MAKTRKLASAIFIITLAIVNFTATASSPKVVKTVPANGDQKVDPSLKQIRIVFDQEMDKSVYSICEGPLFPKTLGRPKWINKTTLAMRVKLEQNHEYELSVNCASYKNFKNMQGESAQIYPLKFKTASAGNEPAKPSMPPSLLLQEGIYAEETQGDLDKAIEIYEQVIEQAGEIQRIAAKAAYHLGMCYLKKGEDAQAAKYFQQVILNYPTQNLLVKKAEEQLRKIKPQTKQSLFEQIDGQVLRFIAEKYGEIALEANQKSLYVNCHVYYVDPNFSLYKGGLGSYYNWTGRTITGKVRLSGTSYPNQTHYDAAGNKLNTEIVPDKTRSNHWQIYWIPDEPLAPEEALYYGWSIDDTRKLSQMPGGAYSFRMQNKFGSPVIETFFLVLPKDLNIAQSNPPTGIQELLNYNVYWWTKTVQQGENHLEQLQLNKAEISYSFSSVVEKTINDDGVGEDFMFDLDTGKSFSVSDAKTWSEAQDVEPEKSLEDFIMKSGVDLFGETSKKSLMGIDMIAMPTHNERWDMSPEDVIEQISMGKAGSPIPLSADGELPKTFVFRTGQGGMGILQITEIQAGKAPRHFKIRYKTLQKQPIERTSINTGTSLKSQIKELSNDDGKSAGRQSIARSGHAVSFESPDQKCYLKAVRIYGSRYGTRQPPQEDFHVYVCDENFNAIADFAFPYSKFQKADRNGTPKGWVTLKIDRAQMPQPLPLKFFICVDFNPEQTKGVYVHHDAANSDNSYIAVPGQDLKPFTKGDWMIRAVVESSVGTMDETRSADSLQSMIDSARPGAIVTVPTGVYTEPISVNKSLTLKGQTRADCVIEVTSNQPAISINTKGKAKVNIENLTIKWQLATSDKTEQPFAIGIKDSNVVVKNCNFVPLGNFQRSPVAIRADGFSDLKINTCRFEGFEYVICYGSGTKGSVENCLIMDCGHQGIILYENAKVKIARNVITGSKYHAVRSTGGFLIMNDNLIINNANRGVYLGNKSASGKISNNIIIGNATGISGFARSKVTIENNIIANSKYAGIGFRDSCGLQIRNNIFYGNQRGWIMFKEGQTNNNGCQRNTFWQNKVDAENFKKTANSILADPGFIDMKDGDLSLKPGQALEHKQGLTNPEIFKRLWKIWQNRKDENVPFSQSNPARTSKKDKLASEDLTSQGWKLWGQRKLDQAEEKFKQATKLDPTNDNVWQGLGWAQFNQSKILNAKDSFEKCIKFNPKNYAALNGLGWIAHGQGNVDQAIQWWEKAVQAQPGATASLSGLTQVYMDRKEYDKAIKYYQLWLKAEPDNKQAKEGLKKAKSLNKN